MMSRICCPSLARATRAWRSLLPAIAAAAALLAIGPAPAPAEPTGRVINGTAVSIRSAPWQVRLWSRGGTDGGFDCGGAIIDAVTVVTAAHCVDGVALGADPTDGGLGVTAGISHFTAATPGDMEQRRTVVDARIHPQWLPDEVRTAGDLAVLELDVPLVLDGVTAAAAALPPDEPLGEEPALVKTPVSVSGYGRQAANLVPTGQLFALDATVVEPGVCGGADNAAALCGRSATGAACSGDSGGPLVTRTSPPILVGIVSNGPSGCPTGEGESYVNLATPENRRFLAGEPHPPIAPRLTSGLVFGPAAGGSLVVGQPVVCSTTFSGASSVRWTITDGAGHVLTTGRGGTGASYWPSDADVGQQLTCVAHASNPGGVAVAGPATAAGVVTRPRTTPQVRPLDPVAFALDRAALTATAPSRVRRGRILRTTVELSQLFGAATGATVCVRFARLTPKCVAPTLTSLQGASYALRVRVPRRTRARSRQVVTVTAVLSGRDVLGHMRQVSRSTVIKVRVTK